MDQYFKGYETLEDLKKQYKELVFRFYPDKGGDTATMQEINSAYDMLFEKLKNKHKTASGDFYEKETEETPDEYKDIILKVIRLHDVEVEICGSWVWVTGATRQYKDYLKESGFRMKSIYFLKCNIIKVKGDLLATKGWKYGFIC